MIFTELILENFGPYAGKNVINLRPEIDGIARPIVLFGGMNGGGKTTLMDAIRLALYGQRSQCSTRNNLSYGEFLTQSVNYQTAAGDCARVELAFEHLVNDRWKQLRIVRTWTKNPKDGKDILGIIEEEWPDTALANTWDEYIEMLLPLGISNLFLFDGEQVKELAEQDVAPQAVIEAIKSLLGLELAEQLAIDLDILINRKRKEIASSERLTNLEEIEAKIEQYEWELTEFKPNLNLLQKQLAAAQIKHQETADKFYLEGGKIAGEKTQLSQKIESLVAAAEQQREEIRYLAASVLPLNAIVFLLDQAKIQAEKELEFKRAEAAREVLQKRDKKLLSHLSEIFLTLEQIEAIKLFLEQENQALNLGIDSGSLPWLNAGQEDLKKLEDLLQHKMPLQTELVDKQLKKLQQLEAEIEFTERELAVAASPEEYQKLDDALKAAQNKLINCQTAYESGIRRHDEIKKTIEKLKKELEKYGQQAIERQNSKHAVEAIAEVQQTLTLFRERLTLKKLNKLEREVSECFRYLLHKSDLVHRVAVAANDFSISLYDFQGQAVPKHRLSAGEKQLLAIAFLWGLARVSGRNLPIAIDTPLGRLDSSHRQNLVERYFPAASHQVILLSTDTEIGKGEVEKLREQEAIARQYLLQYDSNLRQTLIHEDCYFW
jgi:DNA sulfur modification protein DndD